MLYGFDMGGTKIEIAVFDAQLQPVWQKRVPTPQDSYEALLHVFIALTQEADQRFQTKGQVGIGLAGIPNLREGSVFTTNVPKTKNQPLIRDLEKALARPIRIENDANCFALSEAYDDARKEHSCVLGVILGTGLGAGMIINGQPFSGANGIAGEIGHMRLPADCLAILGHDIPLAPCGCGKNGCAERYLSGTGFEWLYAHFYQESCRAPDIIARYYQGDLQATAHVDRFLTLLAAYLGNICTVLDPDLIVFGGGLSNFDEIYRQLPTLIQPYLFSTAKVPAIEKAKYGDSGGVRGAALLNFASMY